MTDKVFLGGSCDPTTWRFDIAIPLLEAACVPYFNPQVKDWTKELEALEEAAKVDCKVHLWVIDSETRAVASIVEVTEWAVRDPGRLFLVMTDIQPDTVINGFMMDSRQVKDLNRGRTYLRGAAERHGVPIFDTVEDAVQAVISRVTGK